MSNIGVNFGSATSGTGFDVASTVANIMAAQRTPEAGWQARAATLGKQDAVLTTVGTNLSALETSLAALTNFDGVFASKQGGVSDTSVLALTATASNAATGSHEITVQQLATTSADYSNPFSATATLSGTLSIQVGSGAAYNLTLGGGSNSIAGLASTINGAKLGVTATVVSDRSGSRLSLVSDTGGAGGQLTLGTSVSDSSGNALTFTSSQTGKDAQYKLDGIALTSASNSITDALTGVQFRLLGTSSAPVSLQIANDTASIGTALSNFVSGYNTLSAAISAQEGKDANGVAQPLFGNPVIANLQAQLATAFSYGQGSGISLSQLGITLGANGKLALDNNVLQSTLNTNFDAAASFFQTKDQFGQKLVTTLNGLDATGKGAVALALKQNADAEAGITSDTGALESRLLGYQATLTSQLNTANQILQGIPQQLNEVNQIYAAITGYSSNGK